jgi:phospholipid-binding lipoprotein MlaA
MAGMRIHATLIPDLWSRRQKPASIKKQPLAVMKRLLSAPLILFLLVTLGACATTPQGNPGVPFSAVASEAAPPEPGLGSVDAYAAEGNADADADQAKPNAASDTSGNLGPPLVNAPDTAQELSDPFEPINTRVLKFNEKTDEIVVRPVVSTYAAVVPPPAREGLSRVFNNAAVIPRFANALFQFQITQAGTEAARFGINSTLGLAGWFDPAGEWFGLQEEDNDFGLTLAKYGIAPGPYVMLPILGPSSVRDVVGMVADGLMDPIDYVAPGSAVYYKYAARAVQTLNSRTENRGALEYLDLYAVDKYGAIQDAYFERRQKQITRVKNSGLQIHLRTPAGGSDW